MIETLRAGAEDPGDRRYNELTPHSGPGQLPSLACRETARKTSKLSIRTRARSDHHPRYRWSEESRASHPRSYDWATQLNKPTYILRPSMRIALVLRTAPPTAARCLLHGAALALTATGCNTSYPCLINQARGYAIHAHRLESNAASSTSVGGASHITC